MQQETNTVLWELDRTAKSARNARDITGETLDIYAEELADLPTDLVCQAIRECRRAETFFPALAEIRKRAVAIVGETVLVDPESSWGEVLREIRSVGYAGRKTYFANGEQHVVERQFSSPFIGQAADSIGWQEICLTEIEDLPTVRAQFRKSLEAIQRREVDRIVSGRATDPDAMHRLAGGGSAALPEEAPPEYTTRPQPWASR